MEQGKHAVSEGGINNGIDPQSWLLSYVTVDDIAARIRKLGKCDIKHAYRQTTN